MKYKLFTCALNSIVALYCLIAGPVVLALGNLFLGIGGVVVSAIAAYAARCEYLDYLDLKDSHKLNRRPL
ncbi:hypothetical protein [Chromobacterium phragmitis]|uniref:Uncharacterized protein n=1 Tax=Chromobacterium phragmitis TaxID=2202141 RepID=A0ABV0J2F8_9NEIS